MSHTISIGTPCFCDSSRAVASAPVRADRNTGFVELFAIIAMRNPAGRAPDPWSPAGFSPPRQAATSIAADITAAINDVMLNLLVMHFPSLRCDPPRRLHARGAWPKNAHWPGRGRPR
ncbi:MAG: hypothetical protein DMF84_29430 [Acidobacteria bacterium]|nr:MAG: hypothetical protein DMF84_29430 [Acidobacteriota bacterium]